MSIQNSEKAKLMVSLCLTFFLALIFFSGNSSEAAKKKQVIVSMGDSYASGEGAPDKKLRLKPLSYARWNLSDKCHRSTKSAHHQTYQYLRSRLKNYHVVYKSFACSGAKINEIIGKWQSRKTFHTLKSPKGYGPVEPQVKQAKKWMNRMKIRRVDAIIINIGGNDAGFGKIIQNCMDLTLKTFKGPLSPCTNRTKNYVKANLGVLPSKFSAMNHVLRKELNPRHIFITEGPDPTKNSKGQFCDRYDDQFRTKKKGLRIFDGVKFVTSPESRLIDKLEWSLIYVGVVIPLNAQIRAAARKNKWVYVDGIAQRFKRHGYCSGEKNRYVNTLRDSMKKQGDIWGMVHPNEKGFRAIRDAIVSKMKRVLNLPL